MKRDPRLHGLSSDHHHALVFARRTVDASATWDLDRGIAFAARFAAEIEPHFVIEETTLLPPLANTEGAELADRTRHEHAELRDQVARAARGDGDAAADFAALLTAHVRFEERELFPACERLLSAPELDAVARLAPKPR